MRSVSSDWNALLNDGDNRCLAFATINLTDGTVLECTDDEIMAGGF